MSDQTTFDYIVVGAGSAGCVVANRLSEDPDVRVAVLEAGPVDNRQEAHIPALWPLLLKSEHDWDLLSEEEPGLNNRRLYLPRGKMLGGSGSINAMIYIRGNRADYDEWASLGATGWSYDEVLPYFKRSEANERGEDLFHSADGPMRVSDGRSRNELVAAIIEAAQAAGHEATPDFNGARQEGVGWFQLTQRDGMRESTADAFLRPATHRPNVTVITGALASRILFEGNRAAGVEIVHDSQTRELRAEREVILSAGAYQTPVLLMLSGIGPEDQLAPWGIKIREKLPVGENLQDHAMSQLNWTVAGGSLLDAFKPENWELFEKERRGPLTSNLPEAALFTRTRAGLDAPDVQFHFACMLLADEGLNPITEHGYCFGPVLLKPKSRGRVMLRTPVPDAKPRVLSNFLTEPEDLATQTAGVRIALEIARQEPLLKLDPVPYRVPASDSDADIEAWLRRVTHPVYHPTSTCSIGNVVDPELRVYGFEGLRIADASVMPTIVRGNTNAASIMIGEKAADMIVSSAAARSAAGVA